MAGSAAFRSLLLAGGVFAAASWAGPATAQERAPVENAPANQETQIAITEHGAVRFTPAEDPLAASGPRRLELALAANSGALDISVAQRAAVGADADGDLNLSGRSSEFRVGRGLVQQPNGESRRAALYMFVASDNEALTWRPGAGSALALESRSEIGDHSAGVTYQRAGMQASLAYVERESSIQVGRESFSQDESFAGITLTMQR